ncbi:MAG TPA: hypothetical protein VIC58_05195 [Actinomycetota bacterium]
MLEVATMPVRALAVLASEEACERVAGLGGACRIGPSEVMVLGDVSPGAVERAVGLSDPDGLVQDVSDGWTLHRLSGPAAREAFARLSELELPASGFVQGEVSSVGARIVAEGDRVDLIVPSMLAEHVRARIDDECRELLG